MSATNSETPIQEAISLVSIGAILAGVVAYVGAAQNVPIAAPALYWIACQVYAFFPVLNGLHGQQVPMLVASASVGAAFWIVGLGFAGPLATLFSASQIGAIEKQTLKLKKNRARIVKSRRDRDDFNAN